MKKLKWAGYAGMPKSVKDVKPGKLAIFCPACPQPGINILADWKKDHAWHVNRCLPKVNFDRKIITDGYTNGFLWQTAISKQITFVKTTK